jgi:hypothetical protein
VTRLTVIPDDGDRLTLQRSTERGLHVAGGIAGDDLAGEPALETTVSALERLRFEDVRPVRDLSERTQDDGRTEVATADGVSYTIRWLSEGGGTWAAIAAEETGSGGSSERFNARHAAWAYKLPAHVVRYLRVSADDLSHRVGATEAVKKR